MSTSRTIVNALIGAIIAVVASFLPFSTLIGGGVSGFLEGGDGQKGLFVGALSGAIMFFPIALIAFVFLGIFGFGFGATGAPVGGFLFLLFFFGFLGAAFFLYTVGLGALGGYIGAYFAREHPDHHRRTREAIGFEARSSAEPRSPDSPRSADASRSSAASRGSRDRRAADGLPSGERTEVAEGGDRDSTVSGDVDSSDRYDD